jgi:hypothetical protein
MSKCDHGTLKDGEIRCALCYLDALRAENVASSDLYPASCHT